MTQHVYEILDTVHRIHRASEILEDKGSDISEALRYELLELLNDYEEVIKEFKVVVG